ncbi:MAG: peptidoglycan bridge formation glycyltransferase FemA/FemB family protein [Gallionella sp.]|nr:peptidoglycan bridge formation glycyltransferase FemA/FemB family protein [Gallionella sp.]
MLRTYFASTADMPASVPNIEPGSLYHSAPWHQVLVEGFNVEVEHLVTELDGRIVALTPLFLKRRYGFSLCGSPLKGLFTEFAGPRFDYQLPVNDRAAVVENQISALRNRGYSYIEIGTKADGTTDGSCIFSSMRSHDFAYQPRPSLVVDLTKGLEQVWASFESRARNMIRKSEKNGVVVQVESLGSQVLGEYVAMIKATFKHQGLAMPHPFLTYVALARNLEPINRLMFVTARHEGRLVSGGIFLVDANRMVFHSGSSTPEGLTLAASSLVQWKAMQEGYGRGVQEYDLGGIGVNSIDTFKKSFGGTPISHHRWVYSSALIKRGAGLAHWLAAKGLLRVFK